MTDPSACPRVFKVETDDKRRTVTIDLQRARLRPLEGFPGSLHLPWWVECELCETQMSMLPIQLARGERCRCVDPWEAALRQGYLPAAPCPEDWREYWELECEVCGLCHFTPRMVLDGITPCPHRCDEATTTVRRAGMTPLAPFPGTSRRPWPMACQWCEAEREITLARIVRGWRCPHAVPVSPAGEVVEAGYLPVGEFPGIYDPWELVCASCGRTRRKRLYAIRRDGDPCRHSPRGERENREKKDLAKYAFEQYTAASRGD